MSHARHLTYDAWANRETLSALRSASRPPARAVAWLAHIVGAEYLWLSRIMEEPRQVAIWPDWDLDACAVWLSGLDGAWRRCLATVGREGSRIGVGYRNSRGEFWTSTIDDILTHVVLHSAYHRGQIADEMRRTGFEPAYTDFIHAVRQRLVE